MNYLRISLGDLTRRYRDEVPPAATCPTIQGGHSSFAIELYNGRWTYFRAHVELSIEQALGSGIYDITGVDPWSVGYELR